MICSCVNLSRSPSVVYLMPFKKRLCTKAIDNFAPHTHTYKYFYNTIIIFSFGQRIQFLSKFDIVRDR